MLKRLTISALPLASLCFSVQGPTLGVEKDSANARVILPKPGEVYRRVSAALGVPATGGLPTALADVLKNVRDVTDDKALVEFKKLAEALLSGLDAEVARETLNANLSVVWDSQNQPAGDYGTTQDRRNLGRTLWRRAIRLAATDADAASKLARASLLLSALEDTGGIYDLAAFLLGRDADKAPAVLRLKKSEFDALRDFIKAYTDADLQTHRRTNECLKAVDRIRKADDARAAQAIAVAATRFEERFKEGFYTLNDEYDWAHGYWALLNHARARNQPVWIEWLSDRLDLYASAPQLSGVTRRVLKGARQLSEAPQRLIVHEVQVNGEWVEKED